jgi:uncharacterized protein (DUF3084 family)
MTEQQEKAFGYVSFNTGKCEWEFFAETESVPSHGYTKPKPVFLAPPSVEALQEEIREREEVRLSHVAMINERGQRITTLEATNAAQAEQLANQKDILQYMNSGSIANFARIVSLKGKLARAYEDAINAAESANSGYIFTANDAGVAGAVVQRCTEAIRAAHEKALLQSSIPPEPQAGVEL